MKKKLHLTSIILLLWMINLSACAKKDVQQRNNTIPDHPRILLLKGEEALIKSTLESDLTWKTVHNAILNECGVLLSKPPVERILIGRRLLDKSREALKRIFYLSYGYRLTGDKRYLDRAETEMLAISAFTDWNPSHFLDVAEMTMAVSIGYDWLYDGLSAGSRKIIKEAIISKGLNPSLDSKYNSWLKGSNNWNQVCNAGMTYGALAVWEDQPEASASIVDRACQSILLPMADYVPDGAYPEGYGYWGYGTSFNVMFISAWEKAFNKKFDVPENTAMLKTGGYLENMTGPTKACFNYSDCGSGGSLQPAMFWIANRIGDPKILWSEKSFLNSFKSAGDRLLPAIMIWSSGMGLDKITPPAKTTWVGQGKNPVALMRTSWTEPFAIYVGMKGGSPKVNHAHMDAGSFVMEANGVRWAMDMGMQDYNSLEQQGVDLWNSAQNSQRWQVFRYNNYVHNTLTINGQLQQVSGSAPITSSSENSSMMNAITDLTTIYNGQLKSANRGIAIVDNSYVTVRDEVETLANETVVRWTLLTPADVIITGRNTAELTRNGKKLVIKVAEPAIVTMKTWSTVPTHDYDAPNPGTNLVGFEAVIPANTKANLQVYLLPENVAQNPATIPGKLSVWPK